MKYSVSSKLRNTQAPLWILTFPKTQNVLIVSPWVETKKKTFQTSSQRFGEGEVFSSFSVLALPKLTSEKMILYDCNFFGQIYEVLLAFHF